MTAENEGRTGHDGYEGYDRYDGRSGVDALMAAITDDPLTDAARADAAFMAEHTSAVADVALLREQLDIIGHALAEPTPPVPEPEPAPDPVPVPVRRPSRARRRFFTVAVGGLGVAAAGSVLVGMGWLLTQAGPGASSDAGSKSADEAAASPSVDTDFLSPLHLACSRVVAEGRATSVEQVPDAASVRVTLDMTRYYKPDKGERELTFVVDEDLVPGLRKGDPVLIAIPQGARQPDFWAVGEQDIAPERAWITASLSDARERTC